MAIQRTLLVLLVAGLGGCGAEMAASPCPGSNPGFVQINVFYNSTTTSAPSVKIAEPNDKLKFNLLGPPGKNVDVDGKTLTDAWLKGSGKNHFYVCVPDEVAHPQDYGYNVKPNGSPQLDPVVRIL